MNLETSRKPEPENSNVSFVLNEDGEILQIPKEIADFMQRVFRKQKINIHPYINRMLRVASRQQGIEPNQYHAHTQLVDGQRKESSDIDDIIDISNITQSINEGFGEVQDFAAFKADHQDMLKTIGKENMDTFDKIIGLDAKGLLADDLKPLLGVNIELGHMIRKYDIYLHEIEEGQ